jgi:hypothetical protein
LIGVSIEFDQAQDGVQFKDLIQLIEKEHMEGSFDMNTQKLTYSCLISKDIDI